MNNPNLVPVGTAIFCVSSGLLLMAKRKGGVGDGTWGLLGGRMEMGEKSPLTVLREATEEAGIFIPWMKPVGWNDYMDEYEGKKTQWVTLFYYTSEPIGIAEIREPNKFSEMGWFSPKNLPSPLFPPLAAFIRNNGVPRGGGPRIQVMAKCPHQYGAFDKMNCGGYLTRARILDAEKLSSTCVKCGNYFGLKLIEEVEAKVYNPAIVGQVEDLMAVRKALVRLRECGDLYRIRQISEHVNTLEKAFARYLEE